MQGLHEGVLRLEIHVGERINLLCRKNRVKKKDLAKHVGVTPAHLSQVISGRENPSPALLEKIANFFNLDVECLKRPLYDGPIIQDEDALRHLPESLRKWVMQEDKKPYLVLAKMIDEKDITAEELVAMVEVLRCKKNF